MSNPIISSQLAVGKVTLLSLPGYNLMAWSGTDDSHSLNIATSANLDFSSASTGLTGNSNTALNGPAIAMLPSAAAAYVAWVGSGGSICVTMATPGPLADGSSIPTWSCGGDVWTIANSTPQSAPAVALGTQNGQAVLNVIWQDGGADSMVLAQLRLGYEADSLAFCSLGRSCIGTPSLTGGSGGRYLAWSSGPPVDNQYTLNLANDPRGGVNFDFDNALTRTGYSCENGMTYVPLSSSHGCAVYSNQYGVYSTQIARNQAGDWVVNTATGSNVTIADGMPTATANAGATLQVVKGVSQPAIVVVWPANYGTNPAGSILIDYFQPVIAPIPVVQYVTA